LRGRAIVTVALSAAGYFLNHEEHEVHKGKQGLFVPIAPFVVMLFGSAARG
jgi:hypothetical protein